MARTASGRCHRSSRDGARWPDCARGRSAQTALRAESPRRCTEAKRSASLPLAIRQSADLCAACRRGASNCHRPHCRRCRDPRRGPAQCRHRLRAGRPRREGARRHQRNDRSARHGHPRRTANDRGRRVDRPWRHRAAGTRRPRPGRFAAYSRAQSAHRRGGVDRRIDTPRQDARARRSRGAARRKVLNGFLGHFRDERQRHRRRHSDRRCEPARPDQHAGRQHRDADDAARPPNERAGAQGLRSSFSRSAPQCSPSRSWCGAIIGKKPSW